MGLHQGDVMNSLSWVPQSVEAIAGRLGRESQDVASELLLAVQAGWARQESPGHYRLTVAGTYHAV